MFFVIQHLDTDTKLHLKAPLYRIDRSVAHGNELGGFSVTGVIHRNSGVKFGSRFSGKIIDFQLAEMNGLFFIQVFPAEGIHDFIR